MLAQSAQLRRRQQAVGDRDPQHRRMALNVQAIAQAQMAELVLAQFAGEESARLVAKLRDALINQRFVDRVIPIHSRRRYVRRPSSRQLPVGMSL